jgi:outer membrane protein
MTHHNIGSILAAALLALSAGTAQAQQAAPVSYKIGFVDTARILKDSRAAQQIQKSLEAEIARRVKEIEAGPKADIERRKVALGDDMNMKRDDLLKLFIDRTNGVIRRVAEAEKFDAVFLEAAFFSARIDITDRVIKAVDSER